MNLCTLGTFSVLNASNICIALRVALYLCVQQCPLLPASSLLSMRLSTKKDPLNSVFLGVFCELLALKTECLITSSYYQALCLLVVLQSQFSSYWRNSRVLRFSR